MIGTTFLLRYRSIEITLPGFICIPSKEFFPHRSQKEQKLQEYETLLSYGSLLLQYQSHKDSYSQYPIKTIKLISFA